MGVLGAFNPIMRCNINATPKIYVLALSAEYTNSSDHQTDRQTDKQKQYLGYFRYNLYAATQPNNNIKCPT